MDCPGIEPGSATLLKQPRSRAYLIYLTSKVAEPHNVPGWGSIRVISLRVHTTRRILPEHSPIWSAPLRQLGFYSLRVSPWLTPQRGMRYRSQLYGPLVKGVQAPLARSAVPSIATSKPMQPVVDASGSPRFTGVWPPEHPSGDLTSI